ncbi:hypothetical protein SDC9_91086 [bioreactor metagenome]|uniref:Uncharacterized protein n=1 Tax=bioreactor metagenome TaxID=1076179 RepID=A0A644ZVF1_9ZZZZ
MALGQRLQPGAQRLADDRAVVDGQRQHDSDVATGAQCQQDEQHHQQHRHAAEELQHDRRRHSDPDLTGSPGEAQHDAEEDGEHGGQAGRPQGAHEQAADQQALPDLALGEDVPAFGTPHTGQLNTVDGRAGLAQRPDEPDEGSGEHDTSDDRHDSRQSPGSRAGGVIQDARSGCTHRCIATFRSTTPASWPSGMVMIR